MVPHIYHTSFILIPFPCAALHSAALLTAPRFKLNTMATRTFRCDADKTFIRFCFVFCLFVGGGDVKVSALTISSILSAIVTGSIKNKCFKSQH